LFNAVSTLSVSKQGWYGMSDRPTGVTIIGVFTLLVSAGVLLGYLILGWMFPLTTLAAAIIVFAASLGMLAGFTWAWYLIILGYIVNIIIGFVFLFSQFPISIVSILFSMLIIFYFSWGNVRKFFAVGARPNSPTI
jgi:hypothetical protein